MNDQSVTPITDSVSGMLQRRGRVQIYFCCCPLIIAFTPYILAARLIQYGSLRLLGRPAASPWARRR